MPHARAGDTHLWEGITSQTHVKDACQVLSRVHKQILEFPRHRHMMWRVMMCCIWGGATRPVIVQVNLMGGRPKMERPQAAYPDVCFAVENYESAFHSLVCRRPCLQFKCVLS